MGCAFGCYKNLPKTVETGGNTPWGFWILLVSEVTS